MPDFHAIVTRPLGVVALVGMLLGLGLAHAAQNDRNQPMHVESDELVYDSQKQASTFSGNVVITQGSLNMRGARLDVKQDAAGNSSGVMSGAPGRHATFRQNTDSKNEVIAGEGERIEYDGKSNMMRLVGNAQMRRLLNDKVQDDVTGNVIVYNSVTEVYQVQSTGNQNASGRNARVRATFAPRESASPTK